MLCARSTPRAAGAAQRPRGAAAAAPPPSLRGRALGARAAPRRRAPAPCRFREGSREAEAAREVAAEPSWRRHFTESEPPDEGSGPQSLVQRAKEVMRDSPVGLIDVALPTLGGLGSFALSDAHDWPAVAVPFTLRKHTLLLPVWAELLLGQFSFAQVLQQPQYRGKALPPDHRDSRLVQRVAERIINAVEEGHGGGFQGHIPKFDWEVVVIDDPTVNAFVLPGGKIVVFCGIIELMSADEDMLATIIGHECAHALARHSAEKISLGLFIALAVQLAAYAAQRTVRDRQPAYDAPYARGPVRDPRSGVWFDPVSGRPVDPRDPRTWGPGGGQGGGFVPGPRAYGANPYDNPHDNPYYHRRAPFAAARGGRSIYYLTPDAEMAAGPGRLPGRGGPFGGGGGGRGGGSPVGGLINIATNLLLQLPFSRRAEAEADLIGLKLMSIAGYRAAKAPETFAKMEAYQARMMGKAASNASYIQDHPRSANRVKLLEGELEMMQRFGKEGREIVLSKARAQLQRALEVDAPQAAVQQLHAHHLGGDGRSVRAMARSVARAVMTALLLVGAAELDGAAGAAAPSDPWRDANINSWRTVLEVAGVAQDMREPSARFAALVPTDAAVASFLAAMGLQGEGLAGALRARPELAKQLAAMHLVLAVPPDAQRALAAGAFAVVHTEAGGTNELAVSRTAGGVRITDPQGFPVNVLRVVQLRPNQTAVVIDRVLFSGVRAARWRYYTNYAALCNDRPGTVSDMCVGLLRSGLLVRLDAASARQPTTLLVPGNRAWAAAGFDWAAIAAASPARAEALVSAPALSRTLRFHVLPGLHAIPDGFTSGKRVATLLERADLSVVYVDRQGADEAVVVAGTQRVPVVVLNIFVGAGVAHGIADVLRPPPAGPVSVAGAAAPGRGRAPAPAPRGAGVRAQGGRHGGARRRLQGGWNELSAVTLPLNTAETNIRAKTRQMFKESEERW
ncbi:oma1 [Scenedesmus sp. PABB004]|nr:oma1 [Scenedesmus sp. PABB004]